MGIDPRIALGVQPVQLQDPTNQLAKMLEIQGAQDNRKINMLKMGEYERGLADENQMRDLTRQSGGDMGKLRDLTYGAGNYKQGMALDKTIGERKTTDLANRKTELEGHLKKFEVAGQIMSNVRDQASWEVARQQTAQVFGPEAAAQMPLQYDPRLVEQKRLQAMSIKDQVAAEHQKLVLAETGRSNRAREGLTAQGQQITMRGQNLTDARARERLDFDRGAAVADAGGPNQAALSKRYGKPSPGFRWKDDGSMEPIPGGPADAKAGAEGEKRAKRQEILGSQADAVLDTVREAKKMTGWSTTGVGGVLASVPMTEARKLAGHVETIKANLGFDRLQQMRDMSPTGGALGQVAVQELVSLQSTVAKLDQLQKPSDVIKALDKIEKHYTKWKETLGGATGGATGDFSKPANNIDSLLDKYK